MNALIRKLLNSKKGQKIMKITTVLMALVVIICTLRVLTFSADTLTKNRARTEDGIYLNQDIDPEVLADTINDEVGVQEEVEQQELQGAEADAVEVTSPIDSTADINDEVANGEIEGNTSVEGSDFTGWEPIPDEELAGQGLEASVVPGSNFEAEMATEIIEEQTASDETVVVEANNAVKTKTIDFYGNDYQIIVTYDDNAQIPEDAELRVSEITEEDENYAALQQNVIDTLGDRIGIIPAHPVLLDISLWYDDQEIEPADDSTVQVEISLVRNVLKGIYTDEESPVLVNDAPLTSGTAQIDQTVQVVHLVDEGEMKIMDTTDTISETKVVSDFETESFSNWLLYLDEDLTDINVTTGDSLTLRPYTEWVWKQSDEEPAYANGAWIFPDSEWNVSTQTEGSVTYTYYTHKTNGSVFKSFEKEDTQLNERYTVVTSVSLSDTNGGFDLQTNKGKTIHVHVTQGSASGKPGTLTGVSGLTVNLFDYDVPGSGNNFDFTHSGALDVESNVATNPNNNNNINTNHDLKFLGYGGSNVSETDTWFWINNYTKDVPQQGIVKQELVNGFPSLTPGLNGAGERGNPSLEYLFDVSSHDHNVYAFPDVDGLFQLDNQGYYYYNSNANYAEYNSQTNSFVLYEHTYSQNTGNSDGANAKPIGFFPFHEYDTTDTQPEMNFNQNLNHHFGMSMSLDFEIPKDRRTADESGNMHDIIYEFSGDDDLWVFIDDELVLDIGGIHQPVTGTINFTTGVITIHGVDNITKEFSVGGHTLKMFYIERGGCDSNLSIRFNLPLVIGTGTVQIAKRSQLDAAGSDIRLKNAVFGVWENQECTGEAYMIGVSDDNGIITFPSLPVKEEGQTYYLKEIAPPEGYALNNTIYTLEENDKNADGDYDFLVKQNGIEIEQVAQDSVYYPGIRNSEAEPIELIVKKEWKDADGSPIDPPNDVHVEFELKRYVTEVTYDYTSECIVRVYRVGRFGPDGTWTYPVVIEQTHAYKGGSVAYINWQYDPNYYQDWKNGRYRIGDGAEQFKPSSGPAEIELPASGLVEVYIYDGNMNTEWADGVISSSITVTGTEGSTHSETIVGERMLDEDFSESLILPTENGIWQDSFRDLPAQITEEGRTFFYEYFITEKDESIPVGYERVYVDGNGNPIKDPASLSTNVSGEQVIINRKLLDVPIVKYWPDFSGEQFTWSATFQLEEMEEKVNEEDPDDDPDNVHSSFTPIEGMELTVSKDQSPQPAFEDLPMYRVHANGTVYRIQYSVVEIAYEVKQGDNIVAKWTKEGGIEVGSRYTPEFDQDAGEHGSSIEDYKIFVTNSLENRITQRTLDFNIHKVWPSGTSIDDNSYAGFVLKRYVHEEYRDYTKIDDTVQWVNITLITDSAVQTEGSRHQTLRVPVGTEMYIVGNIKANTNANKIAFSPNIELVFDNSQNSKPASFAIRFTAGESDMTIGLTLGDNYVVGGRDGFRLSDTYGNRNEERIDAGYSEEFVLSNANGWSKSFTRLPVVEEDIGDGETGATTLHVYSYYIEETNSNPPGFYPVFRDESGQLLGEEDYRFSWDAIINAINVYSKTEITVRKFDKKDLATETADTLKGAKFKLEKYTSSDYQTKDTDWGEDGEQIIEDDGTGIFNCTDLTVGYYKLVEIQTPPGYIKISSDPAFEVKIDGNNEFEVVFEDTDYVTYTKDEGFRVGNEPGVQLPKTGGTGNKVLYDLALMILTIAFIGFIGTSLYRKREQR